MSTCNRSDAWQCKRGHGWMRSRCIGPVCFLTRKMRRSPAATAQPMQPTDARCQQRERCKAANWSGLRRVSMRFRPAVTVRNRRAPTIKITPPARHLHLHLHLRLRLRLRRYPHPHLHLRQGT